MGRKTQQTNKKYYVNPQKFTTEVTNWTNQVKKAKEEGKTPPKAPEYVGVCVMKIAEKMATRPNFSNYTYKDEMISDAIENVFQYIHNFDPEKAQSAKSGAFSYVSLIVWRAFIRRMKKEKKEQDIKKRSFENDVLNDKLSNLQDHDKNTYYSETINTVQRYFDEQQSKKEE